VKAALTLGDHFGKPLYELIPDFFPQGRLTDLEASLWGLFYQDRKDKRKK